MTEQAQGVDEVVDNTQTQAKSGRLVMTGDFIFLLPIRNVAGKSHSVNCTVCREFQIMSGIVSGTAGNISFSSNEKMGRVIAKRHSDYHLVNHKRIVHVVIAPDMSHVPKRRNRKTR